MQSLGIRPGWLYFFILAIVLINTSTTVAQANSSTIPQDSNNFKDLQYNCITSGLYCSPRPDENWHINKPHVVRWNPLYPSLVGGGTLSVSLFLSDNPREPVFIRTSVPNMDGNFPITITKEELYKFDPTPNFSSNGTYLPKKAWFTIIPSSNSGTLMDPRSVINLIDPDAYSYVKPTPTEIPSASSSSSTSSSTLKESETSYIPTPELSDHPQGLGMNVREEFPIYGIILLVFTSLAIIALFLFLLLFWRRRRREKMGHHARQAPIEKDILDSSTPDLGSAQRLNSVSSTGFLASGSRISALTGDSVTSPLPRKTNLSANDAIMLSETFRDLLRKPSWSEDNAATSQMMMDTELILEPDPSHSIIRLEEELALDGVGLHELESKRNLTIIHEPPDSPPPPTTNLQGSTSPPSSPTTN